ncbi:polysaccharide deacetylase family protein [Aureibacillus halotolerans]|uniref:Peptidoglycan/xylan/chitin deacetylase (PgdA/CDA1 family) n=1 Tax=Aureibacillus halotolerans TaxID=1508390 RepID=A0A4R6U8X8_9BACI|nr:polysaccharide deacetylase family protein [Aureibacillus halotolerans]TDQ42266.1 peptidoglycan/xylan/chitin deacetylase (PgdA/CDA1 family) [Aureibacillus halotolerans]
MKTWYVLCLVMVIALVGCQQGAPATTTDPEETTNEESSSETGEASSTPDETTTENGVTVRDDEESSEENVEDIAVGDNEDESEVPEPLYKLNETTFRVEPIADADENVVLLTFDDVPDTYGLEMAKKLKEMNVPAIFFVNGHFIQTEEKKQILKEIYDLGFSIGNHTFSHPNLSDLSPEEQTKEIIQVNDEVEAITVERPTFFRAPFGVNTDTSKQVVAEEGMVWMNWSYGYDFVKEYMSEDAIADIMVNAPELGPGANLLMHDREWTNAALEQIVTGLKEKGYSFVDPDTIQTP